MIGACGGLLCLLDMRSCRADLQPGDRRVARTAAAARQVRGRAGGAAAPEVPEAEFEYKDGIVIVNVRAVVGVVIEAMSLAPYRHGR